MKLPGLILLGSKKHQVHINFVSAYRFTLFYEVQIKNGLFVLLCTASTRTQDNSLNSHAVISTSFVYAGFFQD